MTVRPTLFAAAALLALAMASPASAQEDSSLRAEIEALKAQVRALEARLDAGASPARGSPATPGAGVETQDAPPPVSTQTELSEPAAKVEEKPTEIVWKGAPQFTHPDGWSFKPRGRLQFDVATVSSPRGYSDDGLGFVNELRRGRLGVEGTIPGDFVYKFEIDFADNDVAFTDAFLSWAPGDFGVTIGQHNNFQSLDELTTSRFSTFIERAAFTDAFNFERRVGLSLGWRSGDLLVNAGVFTDDIDALTDDANNSRSVDARAVWMPKLGDTQLHLAGSVHARDLGRLGENPISRYGQRPLVHATDVRFIDTGNYDVTDETSYGLEAAAIHGPLHFAAEAHWLDTELLDGGPTPTYFGGYAELGWFITGESRGYKAGQWDRTRPRRGFGEGGLGAVQLNVRYDYLDLIDAGIVGGKQNGYLASLIWSPIAYARFGIHYGRLEYDDAAIVAGGRRDYSVDALGLRSEIDF